MPKNAHTTHDGGNNNNNCCYKVLLNPSRYCTTGTTSAKPCKAWRGGRGGGGGDGCFGDEGLLNAPPFRLTKKTSKLYTKMKNKPSLQDLNTKKS